MDDWVALIEGSVSDSVDVFFLHTPPNEKRKNQWRWWGNMFYFKMYFFWKGSQILRGIWAGIVCFQLNRVRNQMQELRQKASWWTTCMLLKPPLPFTTPTAGKTCFQCTMDTRACTVKCVCLGMCFLIWTSSLLPSGKLTWQWKSPKNVQKDIPHGQSTWHSPQKVG